MEHSITIYSWIICWSSVNWFFW